MFDKMSESILFLYLFPGSYRRGCGGYGRTGSPKTEGPLVTGC
jgi:hypothetical protein